MDSTSRRLNRRSFLRGSGVAIALPMVEAMRPAWGAETEKPPMRLICVGNPLAAAGSLLPHQDRRRL